MRRRPRTSRPWTGPTSHRWHKTNPSSTSSLFDSRLYLFRYPFVPFRQLLVHRRIRPQVLRGARILSVRHVLQELCESAVRPRAEVKYHILYRREPYRVQLGRPSVGPQGRIDAVQIVLELGLDGLSEQVGRLLAQRCRRQVMAYAPCQFAAGVFVWPHAVALVASKLCLDAHFFAFNCALRIAWMPSSRSSMYLSTRCRARADSAISIPIIPTANVASMDNTRFSSPRSASTWNRKCAASHTAIKLASPAKNGHDVLNLVYFSANFI